MSEGASDPVTPGLTNIPRGGAMKRFYSDLVSRAYQLERIQHWDKQSPKKDNRNRAGVFYHKLLRRYYRLSVPKGLRVLEIGCGHGDLLATLKPSMGVGIDFSAEMLRYARKRHPGLSFVRADAHATPLRGQFDAIILSDLVNDLWDVQRVFEQVARLCHHGTRVILNLHNHLWRIPLGIVRFFGLGAETLEQNWFAPHDVENLLSLAGFEVVTRKPLVLMPLNLGALGAFFNRVLVHFAPFRWFALTNLFVARVRRAQARAEDPGREVKVSVIIPARNEAGNIPEIAQRVPHMGSETEIVFVEGHSSDDTWLEIQKAVQVSGDQARTALQQEGKGKGDAVRAGFARATGEVLMILDADMTVPPEDLPRFYNSLVSGKGEFINGVRLVYPMQDQSMRFANMVGNKFFSLAFTWLLGQPIKDTLCGTKVLWRSDYEKIAANRQYFGDFDPFGDFDLLFGAAKLNLRIAEVPIRYRSRTYGQTNIDRWRHGWLLLRMVWFGLRRIKFV
jgi:SAM-dependent methyltransferase